MITQNSLKMNKQIDKQLINYFGNVVKNIPEFNWIDVVSNGESNSTTCYVKTQFGEFTIERYNYETTMYCLCFNGAVISGYTDNIDTAKSLASYTYRNIIKSLLNF